MKRMMSIAAIVVAAAVAAWAEGQPAREAKAATPQTLCPVAKGPIDKALYVDANGKRVYVCCAGCLDPIKKDPAKYIKEMEAAGITLEAAPSVEKK